MKTLALILSSCALLASPCLTRGEVVIKDGDSIAFMGDSLTQLGYVHKPNGYIHLVIEGLKQAGVNAVPIPAGIGGNTTRDMLARLDRDVIAKKPVWMTLNSGINDAPRLSVEEFEEYLTKIVDRATGAGIKVILLTTTIGSGENTESPDSLKRLKFCEAFRKLATERKLILVDLNTVMTRELTERKKDGVKGLKLTYDGTHLNGIGNQIVAAEILRALGVSETDVTALRKRWDDYPFAAGMPDVSVNDYVKLGAAADKAGVTVDEYVSRVLTGSVKAGTAVESPVAQAVAAPGPLPGISLTNGDAVAILSGQHFENYCWSPSGYMRLLTDEVGRAGVAKFPWLFLDGLTTTQMVAQLDLEVIAQKPVCVLIVPGTKDYNIWTVKSVSESFRTNLVTIIGKLQAAQIKTVIATSYAKNSHPQYSLNLNGASHNDAIRALAKEKGLPLIDFVKVVDAEARTNAIPFDGNPAAQCLVNQLFAAEVLRYLGLGEEELAACRKAWLDKPGAIQFMPSVSVNTYEKLKTVAKASGKDVGACMTGVLQWSLK